MIELYVFDKIKYLTQKLENNLENTKALKDKDKKEIKFIYDEGLFKSLDKRKVFLIKN